MKVTRDEEIYELAMIDFQLSEIARLDEVLSRNGIQDRKVRMSICSEFADSNGTFLDQGWLEGEAPGRWWPELLFSRRELEPEEGMGDMEELLAPEYASNFHEYASGAIDVYFEENNEGLGPLRTGTAG